MGKNQLLTDTINSLQTLYDQIKQEQNQMQLILEELKREERRVKSALHALQGQQPTKSKPKKRESVLHPDVINGVLHFAKERGEITVREAADELKISPGTARRSIYQLREQQLLRLAGARDTGQSHKRPAVYAPMP